MPNAQNVIIGPGTLSYDYGSSPVDVGFTRDGIEVRVSREYRDIQADQAIGVIKKARTDERAFVRTTLLENTLVNLRLAWDQNPSPTPATSIGQNVSTANEVQLIVTGEAPSGTTRTFTLNRCVSIGESSHTYSREEEIGLEVEFEVIKNDGSGGTTLGTFGTVVDA